MNPLPHGAWYYRCCVPIQVFTGAVPFSEMPSIVAMFNMVGGKRPPKPTHPDFIENLWSLMQRCWAHDPHSRPEASESLVLLLTLLVSCSHVLGRCLP